MEEKLKVFIAFDKKDIAQLKELKNQLKPQVRNLNHNLLTAAIIQLYISSIIS